MRRHNIKIHVSNMVSIVYCIYLLYIYMYTSVDFAVIELLVCSFARGLVLDDRVRFFRGDFNGQKIYTIS